jgi:uncharacterized protein (DUF2126 family)
LIAREATDTAPAIDDAQALIEGIAARLEVTPEAVLPAYEDPWHFLEKERKLPEGVNAGDPRLDDPMERDRLARVFERGLARPTGYVLPVQMAQSRDSGRHWVSEIWSTRSSHLFLIPGDSPVGFRLPTAALTHIEPGLRAVARGAVVGRNIWGEVDMVRAARAYSAVIHDGVSAEQAVAGA